MNRIYRGSPWLISVLLIIIIILLAFLIYCTCFKKGHRPMIVQEGKRISWNILFPEGTNKATRDQAIQEIKDYVHDFYDYTDPTERVEFCPCDTLLYNYDFQHLSGAGPSATTAQSKVRSGGSGDALVSNNVSIEEPIKENQYLQNPGDSVVISNLRNIGVDTTKRLAIIDSGIDSALFDNSITRLIWTDPLAATLFNFIPGQFDNGASDKTAGKHGSAVLASALKAIKNSPSYPRLMILKALDDNNRGSAFSVSCALSYAWQKKATLINLSLGYYGEPDPIMHHYIELCKSAEQPIEVFAAAGNSRGNHVTAQLCETFLDSSLKNPGRLFYPACFSTDLANITSVTQMNTAKSACKYQNYSPNYIQLGVFDKQNCCSVPVYFVGDKKRFYEGSSFATPIACGLKMDLVLIHGSPAAAMPAWSAMTQISTPQITIGGKYIQHTLN